MKRLSIVIVGGLVFALSLTSPATAQDVTGTWVLSVQLDAGDGDATFELTQSDGQISGTYEGVLGEQQLTGSIEGAEFSWAFDSQAGRITFSGTVDGDSMEGRCEYGQLGSGTFRGTKRPS